MDEFLLAANAASAWVKTHGKGCHVVGLSRQMDGRWFLRVVTDEPNWCPIRNVFVTREADLGVFSDADGNFEDE